MESYGLFATYAPQRLMFFINTCFYCIFLYLIGMNTLYRTAKEKTQPKLTGFLFDYSSILSLLIKPI